jgi:hypothetical protein
MIRNSVKLLLTLCILTVGGGVVANAQIDADTHVKADIPFAFAVGHSTLPAGTYEIQRLDEVNPKVLVIRNMNEHISVAFQTVDAQTPDDQPVSTTELVFDRLGDRYFLSQVWEDGSATGADLPKSRMETRLADSGVRPEGQATVAALKR